MRRSIQRAALVAVATLFGILAFGFAVGGFTAWLARRVGTIDALWLVAAGFALLALITYGISRLVLSRRRRSSGDPISSIAATLGDTGKTSGGEEPPPGSTLGSLAVVGLVGYLLARQMFRR